MVSKRLSGIRYKNVRNILKKKKFNLISTVFSKQKSRYFSFNRTHEYSVVTTDDSFTKFTSIKKIKELAQ